jgi:hypothetical protein
MRRNTGDHGRGAVYEITVVTGKGLMWGSFAIATVDMCFLLIDVFGS